MKRLRRSEEWLRWLCTELVTENGVRMPGQKGSGAVRIVDGTIVKEPGKTGSQWRILYSLRLPDLHCDFFDLTATVGSGTGESFTRIPVAHQDLMLASFCRKTRGNRSDEVRQWASHGYLLFVSS